MDIFYPLSVISASVTKYIFGAEANSYLAEATNFFIYDVLKISILLLVINFTMAVVRYYMPMERVRNVLTNRRWYGFDYLLAALLGAVTPFCSCSSIPLFIGFLSAGVPLGVTFAFLISSPLVNESSLFLFPAIFGWQTTILYNLVGIGISVLGGGLIDRLKMDNQIQPEFVSLATSRNLGNYEARKMSWRVLLNQWSVETFSITKRIYPYMLLGVGIGALIHGYVPQALITSYLSADSWWTVPAATLIGVPLYANSVTVVPIMQALVGKGIPLGTALAFMTATVTLSLPEALMLRKVMRGKLLGTFFGITILGILTMGYIFNSL